MAVVGSTEIGVENFKSLKNFQIVLDNFNVLVGTNGSGKTNVLELFKFANLCIDSPKTPAYPFRAWAGFNNIVWAHDANLPIRINAKHSTSRHTIEYVATIADSDGQPEYLDEMLCISDYLSMTRGLNMAKFKLDPKFLERVDSHIPKTLRDRIVSTWTSDMQQTRSVLPHIQSDSSRIRRYRHHARKMQIPSRNDSMSMLSFYNDRHHARKTQIPSPSHSTYYSSDEIGFFRWYLGSEDKLFFIPTIMVDEDNGVESFIHQHAVSFFAGRRPIIFLRQLNYTALRESPSVESRTELGEDGMGLVNILFRWRNSHTGLPDRIALALESLFPEWQISFTVTDDGRILLNAHDGNTILHPPSIPDGFYKLLVILTAVELNPKFLLIDEIEASLHAKMIDYVIDELRNCDSNVVITTHSPAVIDAVRLEDLVLLERTSAGTTARRIDNPKRLRKKLNEIGVTASEGWLYGKL